MSFDERANDEDEFFRFIDSSEKVDKRAGN